MSNYSWCHNPNCHKIETHSRVRGSGNNKVLRTVKIRCGSHWRQNSIFDFFCNNSCLFQFLDKFRQEVADIRPVNKPSETPIEVEVKTYDAPDHPYYNGKRYKTIKIKDLTMTEGQYRIIE